MPRHRLRVLMACVLLAPSVPMLFMGEEWAATTPFLFFCDFDQPLARQVESGRRSGFAYRQLDADRVEPNDPATFHACKLAWSESTQPACAQWHDEIRAILAVRRAHIAPHLVRMKDAGH